MMVRQVAYFHGCAARGKETFTEKMKRKIDSTATALCTACGWP